MLRKLQVRAAANALLGLRIHGLEAEHKVPHQKALRALHHTIGHDKARLVQAVKHVLKDGFNRCHTLHLFERVFKASVRRIPLTQGFDVCAVEVFKRQHQGVYCFVERGGAHRYRPVARRTNEKYQR